MKKRILLFIMLLSLLLTACNKEIYHKYSKSSYVLGTIVDINIYSKNPVDKKVFKEVFDKLSEIEEKLTINKEVGSEVEQINKMAGKEAIKVSDEAFYVIKKGMEYTNLTNNKFDITIGSLVKLWNIGFENADVPKDENIDVSIDLIGINNLTLNEQEKSVKLERENMVIDLGAIAKGYAADEVGKLLEDRGYEAALINLGGNILCLNKKPDGLPYKVGVRDPMKSSGDYLGTLEIDSVSVVTSGIYERNFTKNGILYHHILDSRTGYPVENNLASVTIITKNSIDADALSTGTFVMGLKDGLEFTEKLDGVEAIFITKDKEIYLTSGVKNIFNYTGNGYKLIMP